MTGVIEEVYLPSYQHQFLLLSLGNDHFLIYILKY